MRKDRSVPRLATVLLLVMVAMLTMRCESQEPNKIEGGEEASEGGPTLLMLNVTGAPVNIVINRAQGTIRVNPPHVEICSGSIACPHDQFQWQIPGGLREDERLVIRGARRSCFPWPELVITPPDNGALSGPYLPECEAEDKYGFYWPYIVELYQGAGEEPIAKTDPSGIFRQG